MRILPIRNYNLNPVQGTAAEKPDNFAQQSRKNIELSNVYYKPLNFKGYGFIESSEAYLNDLGKDFEDYWCEDERADYV